jgi:hypothetical protein
MSRLERARPIVLQEQRSVLRVAQRPHLFDARHLGRGLRSAPELLSSPSSRIRSQRKRHDATSCRIPNHITPWLSAGEPQFISGEVIVKKGYVVGAVALALVVGAGLRQWRRHATPKSVATEADESVAPQSTPKPSVNTDQESANKRSIVEAAQTHTHPERLSPMIAPTPFNRADWEANPQAYLDVVEPGRCYRTAESPGPDTPQLRAQSPRLSHSEPGGKTHLMVMSAPNSPVTFTAFGGGEFVENGLNSISVKADARGYAGVTFVVPENARGLLPVLVGSPLAVGNQTFLIDPRKHVAENDLPTQAP